jgi:NADH dehydrogenase
LVESTRTHIWKPLLHSIAAGGMRRSQHELNYLAQAHWHHFTCRLGALSGIDREAREILTSATIDDEGREVTPPRRFAYDTLVIAVGSVTNDFGTPGAAKFAVPLETPEQATRFNKRLVNACLRANAQPEPVRPGQLHVAIIGAGATGTELAAELHRTVREVVAYGMTRLVPERDIKIILIEAAPRILPALPERMSQATADLLTSLDISIRTNARVAEVRADGVVLADGDVIASELVVWSAGVKGPEFLKNLGLETNRINQIVVEQTLQTTVDPNIFAIGDCAACPREGFPQGVPPRAQAAHQEASHMEKQINRRLDGRPLTPFIYRDFGSLVSLGRYSTVGNLMGFAIGRSMFIEGHFARLMYRSLYAMHLAALHGHRSTLWQMLANLITRRPEPSVKLH